MLRRTMLQAAAAMIAAALAVTVQAQALKPMKLTLNFLAGGPQAGFMYAKALGLYEKAGIDLTIEEGRGSGTTAQLVATGQTDIGFADAPAAMQLRAKNAPVKIIAPILQTNGFAIITLEETGIRTPADLVGKRVAVQAGRRRRRCSMRFSPPTTSTPRNSMPSTSIPRPSSVPCWRRKSTPSSAARTSSRYRFATADSRCTTSSIATSACQRSDCP